MLLTTSLLSVLSLSAVAYGHCGGSLRKRATSHFQDTCHQIAAAVSNVSEVYFPPDPQYLSDISHAYVSSTEQSACSVEPGSAEDVGKILCILGSTRTPFAVKGGGHTFNRGFSSTPGVQIAMARFKDIQVDPAAATVDVGAGLTWDQVYAALEPYNITVIGGRTPGIGVAGLTLGGGYSWKSSQYGLAIDNIVGYELVLPNGTITSVTSNDADLWFGLRGGLNNFGIVTRFIFNSHAQGGVWGGYLFYPPSQLGAFKDSVMKFQEKNDPKAVASFSLSYSSGAPGITPVALLFYDAPIPPQGIFDDFLTMPTTRQNVSSRSFNDLVWSQNFFNPPSNVSVRSYNQGVPVTRYSPAVFDAFVNQTILSGESLSHLDEAFSIGATLQPFVSNFLSHGSGSAYPPDRSQALFPSVVTYSWSNASLDHIVAHALRKLSDAVHAVALVDGQNLSHVAVYPNNALPDTPLKDIYGGNVPRLYKIRAEIDPEDVMGLAGGFKFDNAEAHFLCRDKIRPSVVHIDL